MSPETLQNLTAVALVLLGIGFIVICLLLVVLVVVLVPCLLQILRLLTAVNLIMTTANNDIMPQLVKLSGAADQVSKLVFGTQLMTGNLGKSALAWLKGIKIGLNTYLNINSQKRPDNQTSKSDLKV